MAPLVVGYKQHIIHPDGTDQTRSAPLPESLGFSNRCLGDNNQLATGHYKMTLAPIFEGVSFSPEVAAAEFDLQCDTVPGSNPEGKPLTKNSGGCAAGGSPASALDIALLALAAAALAYRSRRRTSACSQQRG